jgi:hypothetical protein
MSNAVNRKIKTHLYKSLISSIMLYGAPAWGHEATSNMKKLQVSLKKILRSIYDGDTYTSNTSVHTALSVRPSNAEIKRACAKLYQRIRRHDNPLIGALGNYGIHMQYSCVRPNQILHKQITHAGAMASQ